MWAGEAEEGGGGSGRGRGSNALVAAGASTADALCREVGGARRGGGVVRARMKKWENIRKHFLWVTSDNCV